MYIRKYRPYDCITVGNLLRFGFEYTSITNSAQLTTQQGFVCVIMVIVHKRDAETTQFQLVFCINNTNIGYFDVAGKRVSA